MGQIKHKMGNVGGGVDISHKSKMSGQAGRLLQDMPLLKNNSSKVVGKGMARYLAGESVGMKRYATPSPVEKNNKPLTPAQEPLDKNGDGMLSGVDFKMMGQPAKSGGPKKSKGPAKPKKEKSLQSYDSAYDKLSDEKKAEYRGDSGVEGDGRKAFTKKAKKYNRDKYGTEEPSKDSKEAGLKRKDLAENKKTKDTTKSFDGSGSNKKKGEDKKEGKKRVVAKDADASTRKGRKAMKDADKKSGDSRKEVKSRKLQRKAAAAEGDKKARLEKRMENRQKRLNKKKNKKVKK